MNKNPMADLNEQIEALPIEMSLKREIRAIVVKGYLRGFDSGYGEGLGDVQKGIR